MKCFRIFPLLKTPPSLGKLIEYRTKPSSATGLEEVRKDHIFRTILVENNLVLYAGYGNWYNYESVQSLHSLGRPLRP